MISERISILLREQELLEKNRKRFMDQQLNKEDTDTFDNSGMDDQKNSNDVKPAEEFKKETTIIKEVEENEEEIFL